MKQQFKQVSFTKKTLEHLRIANSIIEDYQDQGYTLTLRQLYYQMVAKDLIPNKQREYDKLGRNLANARLCGLIDWDAIEDRLRRVRRLPHWDEPKDVLESAAWQFRFDKNQEQNTYVEVWVEKDALSSVVERSANKYQVPVMVNRGYGSITMMYDAYNRLKARHRQGAEDFVILYLGDHDPSGLDMVNDIRNRVGDLMLGADYMQDLLTVKHIALTKEQIAEYNPPPNPAKMSDSRAPKYVQEHGYESWEVDALPPDVLDAIITEGIEQSINVDLFNKWKVKEEKEKIYLKAYAKSYELNKGKGSVPLSALKDITDSSVIMSVLEDETEHEFNENPSSWSDEQKNLFDVAAGVEERIYRKINDSISAFEIDEEEIDGSDEEE